MKDEDLKLIDCQDLLIRFESAILLHREDKALRDEILRRLWLAQMVERSPRPSPV